MNKIFLSIYLGTKYCIGMVYGINNLMTIYKILYRYMVYGINNLMRRIYFVNLSFNVPSKLVHQHINHHLYTNNNDFQNHEYVHRYYHRDDSRNHITNKNDFHNSNIPYDYIHHP